jgi:hypothetical protein
VLPEVSRRRDKRQLQEPDTMTTTAADAHLRGLALDALVRLQDASAELGLRVEAGRLPASALAAVLAATEGCCRLLEACQAALPAEGEHDAVGGEADAT